MPVSSQNSSFSYCRTKNKSLKMTKKTQTYKSLKNKKKKMKNTKNITIYALLILQKPTPTCVYVGNITTISIYNIILSIKIIIHSIVISIIVVGIQQMRID